MAPSMKKVFLFESKVKIPVAMAHTVLVAIENIDSAQLGVSSEVEHKLVNMVSNLYGQIMDVEDSDLSTAKVEMDMPNDQESKTALMGILLQAKEEGVGGEFADDDSRVSDIDDIIKLLKLKMPVSNRGPSDVNADPHASPADKVAADRELEKK